MRENAVNRGRKSPTVYRSRGGGPARNLRTVLDMAGGISALVGTDDVVVIKPNAQWWSQGGTNLAALEALADAIMGRPGGFHGEIVIAENCHRGFSPSTGPPSGWNTPFERNSDLPGVTHLGDLCEKLKDRYGDRFSTVHWVNVSSGGNRVFTPDEGPGYVYCDGTGGAPLMACDNGMEGEERRSTIMTYPVFITDRGTVVDLRNGIWENGGYTDQRVRFFNTAVLNHHSLTCGPTSAIKNYFGVVDLSGGSDPAVGGKLTGDYYNFHAFALSGPYPGPAPGMIGRAVGTFLRSVKEADLHITTAEWTGLISRISPPLAHTQTVLACREPVSLDYHSTRYVLYPNSRIRLHHPENRRGPFFKDIEECAKAYGLESEPQRARVETVDLHSQSDDVDGPQEIMGRKVWGTNARRLLTYFRARYFR